MKSKYEILIDEQKFPYEKMNLEERNYYLNIIRICKDVCDSQFVVDGISKGELIQMRFVKNDNEIEFNGSLYVGTKENHENRCMVGYLYLEKDSVLVDYEITRLCCKEGPKVYSVLDEFTLKKDKLVRKSKYTGTKESTFDRIENEEMEGKLKCK